MSKLVIVESPTKARTIRNYLPEDYRVEASMGHIRDLPGSAQEVPPEYKSKDWASLGVNVDNDFEPLYVIPKSKEKVVKELKSALKGVDELILATDEDREGESISWHLAQLLKPKVPFKRMVFHEITREAIAKALENCRNIDLDLVHAQETRRILDRLVGYTLSPLLWKKIAPSLSAGRVQSVAVSLLVRRERERRAFVEANYWDLKASLEEKNVPFEAKLTSIDGKKIAIGSDFDETTGKLSKGKKVVLLSNEYANTLKDKLAGKKWTVSEREEKPTIRKPAPPFTTSTLQQEANRKLNLSSKETMRTAQGLYERGFITYMRTDSVNLSTEAISAARHCIEQMYGKEYLSPQPRKYTTKSKGAQEAHEAIRPAGSVYRLPKETGLSGIEASLYELIWKRTVASQMADARLTQLMVSFAVENATFRSSGKTIDFPGFFRAYVEGSDDPESAIENQEVLLPALVIGDHPKCNLIDVLAHQTLPPARYSEASLVKMLESEGVGRPSTYATIISTIMDRGYAQMRNKALIPTFTAFAVVGLLESNFPDLVDTAFTSKMEQTLDEIATGDAKWLPYLTKFYLGESGLVEQVKNGEKNIDSGVAKAIPLQNFQEIIKISKFGPYVEMKQGDKIVPVSIPPEVAPADLAIEQIETLLRQKTEGPENLGIHPEHDLPIFLMNGPYGPYLQLGEVSEGKKKPKRAPIPKTMKPEDLTLDKAIALLALPRFLGLHPLTEGKIQASLGPYGPYILYDQGASAKEYRSLKKEDDVLTITLDRALEILATPKVSRNNRSRTNKPPLKELGMHPEDSLPIGLHEGPYGIYIKHNKTNVGLPEGETVESMTLEKALKLIVSKTPKSSSTKKTSKKRTKTTSL
jgi:DNA topoisomerase-1